MLYVHNTHTIMQDIAYVASGHMRYGAVVCAEVVAEAARGRLTHDSFFADFVPYLPACSTHDLVKALLNFPPSEAVFLSALDVNHRIAGSNLAYSPAFQRALVKYVQYAREASLMRVIREVPTKAMTANLATQLVASNFRCLAHFTKEHADNAGANVGATMYTVVNIANIRQKNILKSLASQQAALEAVWNLPNFDMLVSGAVNGPWNDCSASNIQLARDSVAQRHALSAIAIGGNIAHKKAPFCGRHLTRVAMRLIMTYGTDAAVRSVGSQALRQNNYEAPLLRMLLYRCATFTASRAFDELRRRMLFGDTSDKGPASEALRAYIQLVARNRSCKLLTKHTRTFVASHPWKMGVKHTMAVLDYVALPTFIRTPNKMPFVRPHHVASSMPPTTGLFLRTAIACFKRTGANNDVVGLVLQHLRWAETRPRAHPECRETIDQNFMYE